MFVLNAYFCRELRFVAILRSKLRFLLRNTGVDSEFTQNFWGKNWRLGALVACTMKKSYRATYSILKILESLYTWSFVCCTALSTTVLQSFPVPSCLYINLLLLFCRESLKDNLWYYIMYLKPYISEDLWILSFSTKTQFNEKIYFLVEHDISTSAYLHFRNKPLIIWWRI